MHQLLLDIPNQIDTKRLILRSYQSGDGPWYYLMSQKNKPHLAQFESDNLVMSINCEEDAEIVVRDFAADWVARKAFFMGGFLKSTQEFVAQIYVGVVNWGLPEFEIGYFVEKEHEGRGYVTEAAKGALQFCFGPLGAHRVRLKCDDTNVRSYCVADRCEMVREGHIRENKKNSDGRMSGTLLYGLLRSEYEALKA
jgi:RimJ/RimL family protein N-acetyltransferase